ncbi:hypothetical protein FJT64_002580 [Amphibalanus amphitrite]|uniref:Uncharacterized protein n=1 Tax=Amphibalanus amphitrite TaxID=1232801 RepID=A0A6A4WNB1_AMPAM|nr:hypothetical protein FJT64_002580 [Amphibalanus amphitrite]
MAQLYGRASPAKTLVAAVPRRRFFRPHSMDFSVQEMFAELQDFEQERAGSDEDGRTETDAAATAARAARGRSHVLPEVPAAFLPQGVGRAALSTVGDATVTVAGRC